MPAHNGFLKFTSGRQHGYLILIFLALVEVELVPQCAAKRRSVFFQRFSLSSWIFNPFWSSRLQKRFLWNSCIFTDRKGRKCCHRRLSVILFAIGLNGYSSYWNAFLFPVCWLHSVTWFPQNMKLSMNRRGETSLQPPPPHHCSDTCLWNNNAFP